MTKSCRAQWVNNPHLFDKTVKVQNTRGGIELVSKGTIELIARHSQVLKFLPTTAVNEIDLLVAKRGSNFRRHRSLSPCRPEHGSKAVDQERITGIKRSQQD